MAPYRCEFTAEVWKWDAKDGWYFVSLPERDADEIADLSDGRTRGFGSVRVEVTIGGSTWQTSVFPDSKRGTYVLPLKQAVRRAEDLDDGTRIRVAICALATG